VPKPKNCRILKAHLKLVAKIFTGLFILAAVNGCASTELAVKRLDANSIPFENSKDSIVVGSIEVQGFEGIGILVGRFFNLMQIPSFNTTSVNFTNSKPFFLILEPGVYEIVAVYSKWGLFGLLGLEAKGPLNPTVNVRFTVKESEAVYIGNLVLKLFKKQQYSITIRDEYEQSISKLQKKFPDLKYPLNKSLMR